MVFYAGVQRSGCFGAGGLTVLTPYKGFMLVRPLLDVDKAALQAYLERNDIRYFTDESNADERFERNRLRQVLTTLLTPQQKEGLRRTLGYLHSDRKLIASLYETVVHKKALRILRLERPGAAVRAADETLKKLGYLISAKERERFEKSGDIVAGRKWAVVKRNEYVYIAPYVRDTVMDKSFKERCRILGIPPKIRPYLFREKISFDDMAF
jgi:tRNA(Ile)-lysidine synthase